MTSVFEKLKRIVADESHDLQWICEQLENARNRRHVSDYQEARDSIFLYMSEQIDYMEKDEIEKEFEKIRLMAINGGVKNGHS